MFIAAKYEEVYPIRLKTMHEKIAHKKISTDRIKQKEIDILSNLDYCITGCTLLDFLEISLFKLNLKDHLDE